MTLHIRERLINALQHSGTTPLRHTRHDTADRPEWHAESLLTRELGENWRAQYSGTTHAAEDDE